MEGGLTGPNRPLLLSPRKFISAGKWETELSWIILIVMDRSVPLSLRAPLLL